MNVAVLVGPQFSLMATAGALEMLDESNRFVPPEEALTVHRVAVRSGVVPARLGAAFAADASIRESARYDLVIVSPLKEDIADHLAQLRETVQWLRDQRMSGALLCSLCTGSFLLAEAGLLSGGRAATHWAFAPLFRARYPNVALVEDAMLVEGDGLVMTGGALAFTNGMLFVIERLMGPDVSIALSKLFVVDRFREHQGAFTIFAAARAHGDEAVMRCQDIMEAQYQTLDIPSLAHQVGMSPRSVRRHFQTALGTSPQDYLRRVRVEAARRQLERTDRSVFDVMDDVGYADRKTFAATFREFTGLSPSAYRRTHSVRQLPRHS